MKAQQTVCRLTGWLLLMGAMLGAATTKATEPGLLFYVSGEKGTTADYSAGGTAEPSHSAEITPINAGAKGAALSCADLQRLAWWAPGNIYAQRGTLSFFWRSRYPVGPTEFPVFRVGYADHSSWDMVWLRIDYNSHGFDAFVTDASLARTRVSVTLPEFPKPAEWVHLALAWDETSGIRFYVNGRLAAKNETTAVYNTALDQFGPHSRIISPYNVQSDYNFTRGGDIDEIRIYDRMMTDEAIATLAKGDAPADLPQLAARDVGEARSRNEWWLRYGWNRAGDVPPPLAAKNVSVRKVEIHDAFDIKRWWWKANDGIRETTWPGVYNRSRLPGRNDYFQLPDWDCYSTSGKSVTFKMPDEAWNHLEISGAAWGKMELLPTGMVMETASETLAESPLFERPKGSEKTIHVLAAPITGREIRFTNVEQEEPIGEIGAYNVTEGKEPAGSAKIALRLTARAEIDGPSLTPLQRFINGRYVADERASMVALPETSVDAPAAVAEKWPGRPRALPLVHVLIPNSWDDRTDGLDGIAIDLPAMKVQPTHGDYLPMNIRVKDPLWSIREMADFTFSVKPGEAHTLWLDLRDRLLPPGAALHLTLAAAGPDFGPAMLEGTAIRLVFKPREAARAEHETDRFTQARDSYAMLVEENPRSDKFNLWVRFERDLKDLLRVNPDHVLGRQYAAVAMIGPRPAFTQPEPPAGVPLWAFRQVTQLGLVEKFVTWYVDHRQIANGELGGGISDDTDFTNMWPGVALMGCAPDKLADSIRRLLDATYANGMVTRGLPTIQSDELHSYEEGINCLGQNLILNYGSPRQLERAMETARGFASITGINAAGHRHIRSSYYSGTKMAVEEPWGWSKSYSYLAAQPNLLLVDFNGNPAARKIILELADGLLAHRYDDEHGKSALPTAIRFDDDRNGVATRGNLPWPLLWGAWKFSGNREYLDPILSGGPAALNAVNANALDLLGLREEWSARILAGERGRPTEMRREDGRGQSQSRPNNYRSSSNSHVTWQLTGDKQILEKLYGGQIEQTVLMDFINTEGSLWIDRVGVPFTELQRARLGGIALSRGAPFPGHAVGWRFAAPANAQSVAILMPDATATGFKVIAYNLETTPVTASMTGWNIDPGLWEITQGLDTNDDDAADQSIETRSAVFERSRSMELTLPPRASTVLTFKLKTPGTPYWSRPDLGIDPEDVVVQGREVRVTVHSLGAVAAPDAVVVLRDPTGKILVTEKLASLPAPVDLLPKSATVGLKLPEGIEVRGCTVEIDPEHQLGEITKLNNAVKL